MQRHIAMIMGALEWKHGSAGIIFYFSSKVFWSLISNKLLNYLSFREDHVYLAQRCYYKTWQKGFSLVHRLRNIYVDLGFYSPTTLLSPLNMA